MTGNPLALENAAYCLSVQVEGDAVHLQLRDKAMDFDLAAGPCLYRAARLTPAGTIVVRRLEGAAVSAQAETLQISGVLAGLRLEHTLRLPAGQPVLEERVVIHNPTAEVVEMEDFAVGLRRRLTDDVGQVLPELQADRVAALPFRHNPIDPADFDQDFSFAQLLQRPGREHRVNQWPPTWLRYGQVPAMHWAAEGWAWTRGGHTLACLKFNQEVMELCLLGIEVERDGVWLRLGGAGLYAGDPEVLRALQPDQTLALGLTRYETVRGAYPEASYAFRAFLDQQGCRFPIGFNPPVHWNELYDNPEWNLASPGAPAAPRMTRPHTYTRALIEEEARKAREYGCEALYLDPGWDTDFGTLLWGEAWLGPRREFVERIRREYGLGVSLHCPLAPWASSDGRGVSSWPRTALQMGPDGQVCEGYLCLASRQYLDEAARRLLAHCEDGVVFLMFDGNWWNGGCWNPDHGHPVPCTREGHVRAQVELARRVHAAHPQVLIEMHDMITAGTIRRYTPVYYKYGLPGSYDENWGFELMWQPMEDILSGRARSLYYYNLGCNVPLYLHIDLRDDNTHCLVLWWYASTCRHLGIGGTHPNPAVAQAQRTAMTQYRRLARFFKEGDFYGMGEEIHVHVLPGEHALVVNLFNLSGQPRTIAGQIEVSRLGLDPNRWYHPGKGCFFDRQAGCLRVSRPLPAWGAEVVEVRPGPA
ncbi:MAG: hypothetical protein HYW07_17400 [Candidatus Latescibacteria bacterium]|nr:hypothetical protein [Candidatus Latescibacterota bacterium]